MMILHFSWKEIFENKRTIILKEAKRKFEEIEKKLKTKKVLLDILINLSKKQKNRWRRWSMWLVVDFIKLKYEKDKIILKRLKRNIWRTDMKLIISPSWCYRIRSFVRLSPNNLSSIFRFWNLNLINFFECKIDFWFRLNFLIPYQKSKRESNYFFEDEEKNAFIQFGRFSFSEMDNIKTPIRLFITRVIHSLYQIIPYKYIKNQLFQIT